MYFLLKDIKSNPNNLDCSFIFVLIFIFMCWLLCELIIARNNRK